MNAKTVIALMASALAPTANVVHDYYPRGERPRSFGTPIAIPRKKKRSKMSRRAARANALSRFEKKIRRASTSSSSPHDTSRAAVTTRRVGPRGSTDG